MIKKNVSLGFEPFVAGLKTGSDFCGYLVQAIGQDYVRLEVKAR